MLQADLVAMMKHAYCLMLGFTTVEFLSMVTRQLQVGCMTRIMHRIALACELDASLRMEFWSTME